MQLELHQQKVMETLLFDKYAKEMIDSAKARGIILTSPKMSEYYKWLHDKGFISKEHLKLQLEELNEQ